MFFVDFIKSGGWWSWQHNSKLWSMWSFRDIHLQTSPPIPNITTITKHHHYYQTSVFFLRGLCSDLNSVWHISPQTMSQPSKYSDCTGRRFACWKLFARWTFWPLHVMEHLQTAGSLKCVPYSIRETPGILHTELLIFMPQTDIFSFSVTHHIWSKPPETVSAILPLVSGNEISGTMTSIYCGNK